MFLGNLSQFVPQGADVTPVTVPRFTSGGVKVWRIMKQSRRTWKGGVNRDEEERHWGAVKDDSSVSGELRWVLDVINPHVE